MKKRSVLFMALFLTCVYICLGQNAIPAINAIHKTPMKAKADSTQFEIIGEFGAATSINLKGGAANGYSLAFEMTPIEHWLELEFGVSPVYSRHSSETDADLLFKKPWTLSKGIEFMFGVGPVLTHQNNNGIVTNGLSGEAALDFMFWPFATRRFGWFLEPAYQRGFGRDREQSAGMSAGLLVTIR